MALTELSVTSFAAGEDGGYCVSIDAAGIYAYYGLSPSASTPGKIVKVRISDNTPVATLTLPAGHFTPRRILIDDAAGYMLVACSATPIVLDKIDIATFAVVASVTFPTGANICVSAVLDTAAGVSYWGDNSNPCKIHRVVNGVGNAAPVITYSQTLTGYQQARSLVMYGGYLFVGVYNGTTNTHIRQYQDTGTALSPFGGTSMGTGQIPLCYSTQVTSAGIAYYTAGAAGSMVVWKVDLTGLTPTKVATLTLPTQYSTPNDCVLDVTRNRLYAAMRDTPTTVGAVINVNLADFATVEYLTPTSVTTLGLAYSATADVIMVASNTAPATSTKIGYPVSSNGIDITHTDEGDVSALSITVIDPRTISITQVDTDDAQSLIIDLLSQRNVTIEQADEGDAHVLLISNYAPSNITISQVDEGDVQVLSMTTSSLTEKYWWAAGYTDTGLTNVTVRVQDLVTGYFLDHADSVFKQSGHVEIARVLTQVLSSPVPVYECSINCTNFSGLYRFIPYSPTSTSKPEASEARFVGGVIAADYVVSSITALPSATQNANAVLDDASMAKVLALVAGTYTQQSATVDNFVNPRNPAQTVVVTTASDVQGNVISRAVV